MFRHRKLKGYIPNHSKIVEKTMKEVPSGDGIEVLPLQNTLDDADVPYIVSHDYSVVEYVGDGAKESTRYCGDLFEFESYIDKCFGTYSRYVSSLISDNYKATEEIKERMKSVLGKFKFNTKLC